MCGFPRQGRRSVDGRPLVEAARSRAEVSHHDCADGDAGGAAPRGRGGDVSRRATVVEHADVPQQQLEPIDRAGGKGCAGQLWWQFYPRQDIGASQELLERAQGAGYTAMVITVDQQASYYERSQHDRNLGARVGGAGRGGGRGGASGRHSSGGATARMILMRSERRRWPRRCRPASATAATGAPTPARTVRLRGNRRRRASLVQLGSPSTRSEVIRTPVVVKGMWHAKDARLCVENGFDDVVVSITCGRLWTTVRRRWRFSGDRCGGEQEECP